jgi:malonate-semialdehyde dehydrogenase (acetylating) / methylmalonate-semialdehyde dehydrogenase
MQEIGHFIGGKPAAGSSGKFVDVYNTAAGEFIARLALASTA